jgi:hypothetical protein
MADPFIWQIEDGVLAFAVVDTAAVGYLPSWNAPGGVAVGEADIAAYDLGSAAWRCQVTAGTLTPTADTTEQTVPATFCVNGRTIPTPMQSTWTLDVEILQDPHAPSSAGAMGLAEFTYRNDAREVYFLLGLNGDGVPPQAVGRVRMSPTAFGGTARTPLTATASWPVSQWPDIAWGMTPPVAATAGAGTTRNTRGKTDATADE